MPLQWVKTKVLRKGDPVLIARPISLNTSPPRPTKATSPTRPTVTLIRADEAVDISYTKDRGTPPPDFSEWNLVTPERDSLYVGWTEPGEWLHYTVLVEKAGRYSVDVMYTSNGEGRFGLSVDGVPIGAAILPSTHRSEDPVAWRQWHHWNRLENAASFDLPAGLSVLTIHTRTGGNMNYATIDFRRVR